MSVKKEMLEQIALLEKGIALDYSSYLKAPTVIHNCEVEIERAKKEEKDEEIRNNIIKVHTEQIEENKKNADRCLDNIDTYKRMRQSIIDACFPGIIGAIRVFFKI